MPRTQADSARRPTYIIVPYNGKIADITETDVARHNLDLATALGETRKIISLSFRLDRAAGTGFMFFYPNEGAALRAVGHQGYCDYLVIADGTQRLQYALSVANDDWDLTCFGYVVEL